MTDHLKNGPTRLSTEDYTVGWICAIPKELQAARAMLDTEHRPLETQARHDENNYILGSIGGHNVIIACLPEYGTVGAATAAKSMQNSFPSLRFGLMVGVGGGIPSSMHDIRLGDIVVSLPSEQGGGVVQYDLGRLEVDGFCRVKTLNKPPTLLRTAVATMRSDKTLRREIWKTVEHTFCVVDDDDDEDETPWTSPGPEKDALYEARYIHNRGKPTCAECPEVNKVARAPRKNPYPSIHYGNIASGNLVMKDAVRRDLLGERENVICFEMEAAGLMDDFPCLVIRGISDYADSHKNWEWQPYAAAVAAAYAKKLLGLIAPERVARLNPIAKKNVHWTVDRIVNPLFTGRQDILDELKDKLCKEEVSDDQMPKIFIIYGMGGSGKSEVCLKFAHDNREKFWGIFWIDGTSEARLRDGYKAGCRRVTKEDVDYARAKEWFENLAESWLVILDNCDDPEINYKNYFPSGNRGTILMTTRNPDCTEYSTIGCREFQKLGKEESITLLLKACRDPANPDQYSREDASPVVAKLSEHALALTQAGAYIRKKFCKMHEYPSLLESQRKSLLRFRPQQGGSIYGDVYATFEVSAAAMEKTGTRECSDALELLGVLAHLDRNGVSEEIVSRAWNYPWRIIEPEEDSVRDLSTWHISHRPGFMRALDATEEKHDLTAWRKARGVLLSFSLITLNPATDDISMHPLAHGWAKDRLEAVDADGAWAAGATLLALSIYSLRWEAFFAHPRLYSHLDFCLGSKPAQFFDKFQPAEVCRIFDRFAWVLYQLGHDKRAYEIISLLSTRIGRDIQPHTRFWRDVQYLHAACLGKEDKTKEAICLLEQIVDYDRTRLAAEHTGRLYAQEDLAMAYEQDGQNENALNLLKNVLRVQQRVLEPAHEDLLSSQHDLALTYYKLKKYQQALKLQKRVVHARQIALDAKHPILLTTKTLLATIYLSLDQPQRALKLFKAVFKLQKKTLHTTNSHLLSTMHELARAYSDSGEPGKALKLLKKVVELRARTLDATHLDRLASQHNLAKAYSDTSQPTKALKLLENVVEIRERVLDATHPDRLASQHNLARTYSDTSQPTKALKLLEKVVEIKERVLDATHPSRLVSQNELAVAYLDTGQPTKALEILEHVVEIRERVLDATDPGLLVSQYNLAWTYWNTKQYQEAVQRMEVVVKIQSTTLHPEDESRKASEEWLSEWKSILNEGQVSNDNGRNEAEQSSEGQEGEYQGSRTMSSSFARLIVAISDTLNHAIANNNGETEQALEIQEGEVETASISSCGSSLVVSDASSFVISEIGSPYVMSDDSADEAISEAGSEVEMELIKEGGRIQEVDEEEEQIPDIGSMSLAQPTPIAAERGSVPRTTADSPMHDGSSDSIQKGKRRRDRFKEIFKRKGRSDNMVDV